MSTAALPADWIAALLLWADRYHPEPARQTRAVATRPDVFARYVSRLFDLWVLWAAREVWPIWTAADRARHLARLDELAAAGMPQTDREWEAFHEVLSARGERAA